MTTETNTALYRLLTWLSPAYPVGAFSFSQGLETAVHHKLVTDMDSTRRWLQDILEYGSIWSDAAIFANAHGATTISTIEEINEFALAFQPSAELKAETLALGRAFVQTTLLAWPSPLLEVANQTIGENFAYPCAVACAASGHDIELIPALQAWCHSSVSNLVSAAIRLVPLGQSDGQKILAALERQILTTAERAAETHLDNLVTSSLMAEICSMQHETQHVRLFRS
ncbi:MAG: urease accessory protein UreF [Pseudomonadota bacterium]